MALACSDVQDTPRVQAPVIGVMGGSFNPIHLGHVLLAVTVRETKPVDEVVLVPVFKHPVKTDLLPYEDRLAMCRLAVQGKGIEVSTIEQETGESNVVMLRALRAKYPEGSQLFWVCGDDVFEWIENPKGQAMMRELDGLIVQRRLHRDSGDSFYKCPMDSSQLASLGARYGIKIDVIFGELPHFSSTLVRTSPESWKAYLPSCVGAYLERRPRLLQQALSSAKGEAAEADAPGPKRPRLQADPAGDGGGGAEDALRETVTGCTMRCIAVVHGLQRERGCTLLALSAPSEKTRGALGRARADLDELLRGLPEIPAEMGDAHSLAEELKYTPEWLARDRGQFDRHLQAEACEGAESASAWLHRVALLRRYNARIDVLLEAGAQLLETRVAPAPRQAGLAGARASGTDGPETESEFLFRLFCLWARGKEALGRERAFICAGGKDACGVVRRSLRLRSALSDVIEHKEMVLKRIFSMEQSGSNSRYNSVEALHVMLTRVTAIEWSLLGCFAAGTPQHVQHKVVSGQGDFGAFGTPASLRAGSFDVEDWFETSSSAVNLMLAMVQGLAAGICMTRAPAASGLAC